MTKEACSGYAAERLMATPGEGVQTEFDVEDDSVRGKYGTWNFTLIEIIMC